MRNAIAMDDQGQSVVGTSLRLASQISAAQLRSLSDLLADILEVSAPLPPPASAAALLLGDPNVSAALIDIEAPIGTAAVHEAQRFSGCDLSQLTKDVPLALDSEISNVSARYRFAVTDSDAQIETRVRFQSPEQVRALRAPKFKARMLADEGLPITGSISMDHVRRYRALSNDMNPIHADNRVAIAAGFERAVVPGMLLCGLAETACFLVHGAHNITDIRARFVSAAFVEEDVKVMVGAFVGKTRVFVLSATNDIRAIVDISSGRPR
ncbi:MaoC/PaaZ C-terminal domain-containing protein [Shimia sp. NS0008-38b]|uniref:MaoC/PaaZ C-terminal domain-containing protein n=1 Tax=Shimia sp. NS0008-38b TaxID=3127653 RepID=UPI00333F4700